MKEKSERGKFKDEDKTDVSLRTRNTTATEDIANSSSGHNSNSTMSFAEIDQNAPSTKSKDRHYHDKSMKSVISNDIVDDEDEEKSSRRSLRHADGFQGKPKESTESLRGALHSNKHPRRSSTRKNEEDEDSTRRSLAKGESKHSRHSRRSMTSSRSDSERKRRDSLLMAMENGEATRRSALNRANSADISVLHVDERRRRSTFFNNGSGPLTKQGDLDEIGIKQRSTPARSRSLDSSKQANISSRRRRSSSNTMEEDHTSKRSDRRPSVRRSNSNSIVGLESVGEHSRKSRRSSRRRSSLSEGGESKSSRRSMEEKNISEHQTEWDLNNSEHSRRTRRSRSYLGSKVQIGAFPEIDHHDRCPSRRRGVHVMAAMTVDNRREQRRLARLEADNQGLRRRMEEDAREIDQMKKEHESKSRKRRICCSIFVFVVLVAVGAVAFMAAGKDAIVTTETNTTVVIIREIVVYMDVTITDEDIDLYGILRAFESAFDGQVIPSLGCDAESSRMLERDQSNLLNDTESNESAMGTNVSGIDPVELEVCEIIAYVTSSADYFGSCDCGAVQPCYRIIIDLEVSLNKDENMSDVLDHIAKSITPKGSSDTPLIEKMKLPNVFRAVDAVEVLDVSPTGVPTWEPTEMPSLPSSFDKNQNDNMSPTKEPTRASIVGTYPPSSSSNPTNLPSVRPYLTAE